METINGLLMGCSPSSASSKPAAAPSSGEESTEVRRGPWTVEEDLVLINYIENHGEGRWNSLAHSSGLKRTGKSCRLRWLNYLRPNVRRGNITPEEQLLILQLHSRWGNRWSKIAQYLPGRTDNEIKNYWRTRVQKHAKQLRCDVNSKRFQDVMRYLWVPRLLERIRAGSTGSCPNLPVSSSPVPVGLSVSDCYSFQDGETNSSSDEQHATVAPGFHVHDEWTDIVTSPIDTNYFNLGSVDGTDEYGNWGSSFWNGDDIWL